MENLTTEGFLDSFPKYAYVCSMQFCKYNAFFYFFKIVTIIIIVVILVTIKTERVVFIGKAVQHKFGKRHSVDRIINLV